MFHLINYGSKIMRYCLSGLIFVFKFFFYSPSFNLDVILRCKEHTKKKYLSKRKRFFIYLYFYICVVILSKRTMYMIIYNESMTCKSSMFFIFFREYFLPWIFYLRRMSANSFALQAQNKKTKKLFRVVGWNFKSNCIWKYKQKLNHFFLIK